MAILHDITSFPDSFPSICIHRLQCLVLWYYSLFGSSNSMAESTQPTLEKRPSYNTFLVESVINLDATSCSSNASSFFTCEICAELAPSDAKFRNMNGCSHNYCTGCVAKYIETKVIQDSTSKIKCPDTNCSAVLDTLSCRPIVSGEVFEKWCRAHCESAVLLQSSKGGFAYGRSYCPYRDCSELVLNECVETNSTITKVTKSNCPSCKRLFCFHCMVPWKDDHRCVARSETVIDIDSNDVLFFENAKCNKWVRCPSCSHYVERNKGCELITCRCETVFCHNCGEQACICEDRPQVNWPQVDWPQVDWPTILLIIVFSPLIVPIVICMLIVHYPGFAFCVFAIVMTVLFMVFPR